MFDSVDLQEYSVDNGTLRKRFTKQEDQLIQYLYEKKGIKSWVEIGRRVPGRTARQCRDRYKNYLFKGLVKRPWTPEEDQLIIAKYKIFGAHWVKISQFLNGRSGNNVKNRWHKYLCKNFPKYDSTSQSAEESQHEPIQESIHEVPAENTQKEAKFYQKITFPEILTSRPWEIILPHEVSHYMTVA
ncbi:Myb-like DNA-binding domain containing protein [Trichomonas vaginalis G3]|uniref:Myb-like DNA-binding domain containing protein n=1 Tax=Trichomonas vaginalis (strain ATCC PRA-98 / G3) TaxID=412133 RepID=A2F8P5_TRIV3|nr:RNA polymerase II transcription regulator recruiting protein [Trichomonas vaginalis G3]EAX98723.1 Myb-like DNA-binding domain containing protein [Trichomonas vaginalis G3]KAI5538495.1 RNA polymerase II transcription regulator recruiting protein [Trichomonas vaginalis G3]|eukprot:XP_001311653.1 Myb-like DNA-binding domain containing protein [Trichomonas vaginalis G3]